jgi:hypothetical protein
MKTPWLYWSNHDLQSTESCFWVNKRFNGSIGPSIRTRFTCMVRPSWPRVIEGSVTHNFCGAHLRIRVDKIRLVRLASSRDHHLWGFMAHTSSGMYWVMSPLQVAEPGSVLNSGSEWETTSCLAYGSGYQWYCRKTYKHIVVCCVPCIYMSNCNTNSPPHTCCLTVQMDSQHLDIKIRLVSMRCQHIMG